MSLGALAGYGDSSDEEIGVVLPSSVVSSKGIGTEAAETPQAKKHKYLDELPAVRTDARPDEAVVASLMKYVALRREHGFDLTEHIKGQKDFGNPQILEKVIAHFGIDPLASNYPTHLFDPLAYKSEDYLEAIRERQQTSVATGTTSTNAGADTSTTSTTAAAAPTVGRGQKRERVRRWDVPDTAETTASGMSQPQDR